MPSKLANVSGYIFIVHTKGKIRLLGLEIDNIFLYNKLIIFMKGELITDINVGDILEMKKEHPCGNKRFSVLRVGMDFKIRCEKCGHEIMLPRQKAEKGIKKIVKAE